MTKIVSVGEICLDIYLNQNKTFVGGRSLNFAVQAKRCGTEQATAVLQHLGAISGAEENIGK